MKSLVYIGLLSGLLISCNTAEKKIKENLKSRYENFEITEIEKDSANVYTAYHQFSELKADIVDSNLRIDGILQELGREKNRNKRLVQFLEVDSIYHAVIKRLEEFENTRYSRPDKCYYVKYNIPEGDTVNSLEEYFYLAKEVIVSRPVNWDAFLLAEDYDEIAEEVYKFTGELFSLRNRITGTYTSRFE